MKQNRIMKYLLVCALLGVAVICVTSGSASKAVQPPVELSESKPASYSADDYVGTDACKDCHEDQFKAFSHTSHAQLSSRCDRRV